MPVPFNIAVADKHIASHDENGDGEKSSQNSHFDFLKLEPRKSSPQPHSEQAALGARPPRNSVKLLEIDMVDASFAAALTRLWPHGDEKIPGLRTGIIDTAPAVFAKYGINTPLLVAHVMAQISHECGAGHDVVENLSYTANRMTQVWPARFPSAASADPYAGNPRALANKVYNGRMGNAIGTDDGWNFRGRGASQTTGREGYVRLALKTGLDVVKNPDLVNDPRYFMECGVADFINCGCLPYAKNDDVLGVTKRLNGGTVGLNERKIWLAKWKGAIDSVPVSSKPPIDLPDIHPSEPKPATKPSITAGNTKPAPTDLHEKDNAPNLGPQSPAPSFATAFASLFALILSLFKRK
jgi:putative chitinase